MKETALHIGTVLRGKAYSYRIEEILGQGSFGITYKATIMLQGELGMLPISTSVAIKEFFMRDINGREDSVVTCGSKNGIYDNYKHKFANEAINLSKLHHPNIIKVLELFHANNTVYYVMDYVDGGNLNQYIESKKGLSERESITLIKTIGKAISYMHNNKMLHLDLKPSNIMMRKNGEPILIDFGLSKQFDENGNPETSTSIGGGTPGYAPIEQVHHNDKDFPVTMDIYALGATLFKMLTGVRPPESSFILNDGFPAYMLQEKNVSNKTMATIAKAMAVVVKSRYAHVQDFMDALPCMDEDSEETVVNNTRHKSPVTPQEEKKKVTPEQPRKPVTPETPCEPEQPETIKWIDIRQLLETIPYKTRFASVSILTIIGFILLIAFCDDIEIEWFILTLAPILGAIVLGLFGNSGTVRDIFITILSVFGTLVFLSGSDDCWHHVEALLPMGLLLFAIILVATSHSGIIAKIYNIEDNNTPYRRIQNKYGKMGLCYCGKMKIRGLLPYQYDSITQCDENSYICNRSGLIGVYNTQLRKMVIPLAKYPITIEGKGIVGVHRNGSVLKFTTKGYRIPN